MRSSEHNDGAVRPRGGVCAGAEQTERRGRSLSCSDERERARERGGCARGDAGEALETGRSGRGRLAVERREAAATDLAAGNAAAVQLRVPPRASERAGSKSGVEREKRGGGGGR